MKLTRARVLRLAGTYLGPDFVRYFAASVFALAADLATLSLCLRVFGVHLAGAATAGFVVGALVAYVLSVRWVFRQRTYAAHPVLELATFIGIGVAGLGVTQLVLWVGVTGLGLLPEIVKLAAACLTFLFNFVVRKALLFVGARATAASGDLA